MEKAPLPRPVPVALLLLLAVVIVRTAWVCDDAQITFRTVLNWQHGWGLRWNIAERVQSYTHPLWMLLVAVASFVTRELFLTTLGLSLVCSLGAAGMLAFSLAHGPGSGAVALAALISSKAFVDFSTGGLENPLAYLLLALLVREKLRQRRRSGRDLARVVGIGSLLFLTRMDLALLVAPLVLLACRDAEDRGRVGLGLLVGGAPALGWLAFSTFYYGFPFPNTAYAKLGAGIPTGWLLEQGFAYLAESWTRDPWTLLGIGLASLVALLRGDRVSRALTGGALLYLLYVLRIGGDFMSGRFLAVPFFAAVLAVVRLPVPSARVAGVLAALCLGAGFLARGPNLLSGADYAERWPSVLEPPHLIADERAYYWKRFGLLAEGRPPMETPRWPSRWTGATVEAVRIASMVGEDGLTNGPDTHLVDRLALTDPLLARLPARRDRFLRAGHLERLLPSGYVESLFEDGSRLADPGLAAYYERLRRVTRGPLLSWSRLVTLMELNLGWWDHLIYRDRYLRAVHPQVEGSVERIAGVEARSVHESGAPASSPGILGYRVAVDLPLAAPVRAPRMVDLSIERDDVLLLRFYDGAGEVGAVEAQVFPSGAAGTMRRLKILLPRDMHSSRIDRVRAQLLLVEGAGRLGHLRLVGAGAEVR